MTQKLFKALLVFLISWIAVFFLLGYTASKDMEVKERIIYSGICAVIIIIGVYFKLGETKTNGKTFKKKSYEIATNVRSDEMYIFEGEFGRKLIYRIQNNKIYEGLSNKYNYEIIEDKIYKALSPQWIFRIEGNRIYKGLDKKAAYRIEKNKVYEGDFGRIPVYRISSSING
ncbi:MAG: hypothetical protein E7635_03365 [Ruminococcaceae bacterium]|nr:hypothetical protein [Oscillospiraceae bacterium]